MPRIVARALVGIFVPLRSLYFTCLRVFIAEPLFKGYCKEYGKNLRTDIYVHWVQGSGDIVLGDDVLVDGKCSITFAARYTARPELRVGDHTGIGHGCLFTIAKRISIGSHCRIAQGAWIFDSPGHPSAPNARMRNEAAADNDVRPVTIGDNVWIGGRAVIFPGVTIGEGSIVAAAAVVTGDVPPYTIVAGNPARRIGTCPPEPSANHDQP